MQNNCLTLRIQLNRKDKMLLLLDQTLRASQLEKEGGIDLILFEVLIVAVLGSLVFFFFITGCWIRTNSRMGRYCVLSSDSRTEVTNLFWGGFRPLGELWRCRAMFWWGPLLFVWYNLPALAQECTNDTHLIIMLWNVNKMSFSSKTPHLLTDWLSFNRCHLTNLSYLSTIMGK